MEWQLKSKAGFTVEKLQYTLDQTCHLEAYSVSKNFALNYYYSECVWLSLAWAQGFFYHFIIEKTHVKMKNHAQILEFVDLSHHTFGHFQVTI